MSREQQEELVLKWTARIAVGLAILAAIAFAP
jgi:hypothetical protein